MKVNDRVYHPKYKRGTVKSILGNGVWVKWDSLIQEYRYNIASFKTAYHSNVMISEDM